MIRRTSHEVLFCVSLQDTVSPFDNGRTKRVTLCRDARSERPLYQRLQHRDCNGDGRSVECLVGGRPYRATYRCSTTDAQTERPYIGLLVSSLLVSL